MKVENKTTSAASSVQTKPASQKPSSEVKKNGPPVTAEKPSAMPEKISTEDKYEKERKSDKKEEFFDNVSDLRSMSEKTSLKKEEKPEKLAKEKERKNLITSILSVFGDALRVAQSAIDKLSSLGDSMPCGKTDEQTDPYSVINKAALEVPEDTKKLLDNLFVMTAAEVKDNVAPLEKKGEEKLAENTVKECRNNHEELRNEWKKRQKFLDKGSDRERTIKNPDGTETRVSTRKKTDAQEGDYSLYELREEKDKSGKTISSRSSLLNRDKDGNFIEHAMERDSKGNEMITDRNVKGNGDTDEKILEKRNELPPVSDRIRTRDEKSVIRHKLGQGQTISKEEIQNPDGTKTLKIFERSVTTPEVNETEETVRKDRNGREIKDKSTSTYTHNIDGTESKIYERDDGKGNKEYSKLTLKSDGISERESVTTKSDGTIIKSKETTYASGRTVIVSDEERPDGSKIHKEKTVEYNNSSGDKTVQTGDKPAQTGEKLVQTDKKTAQIDTSSQAKYDPGKEAEVLNNAMAGWGANKEAIYNVLKGKSPEELKALKESYKAKYGKELEEAVKSELKGVDLYKAKALLDKGNFSQADNIKQSLDSWSIRKGDVVKILDGKTWEEIKAIKEEYKKTYGTELDEDLNKTLLMSPIEKEKIKLLMNGEPQADMNIKDPKEREKELLKRKGEFTASKIELDIKALMSVPPPPKSYETKALLDTLYGKSPEEIKAYKDAYKKATGKDLEKTIDILLITSPSNRAIAKSYMTQGKETDAEKLHRAMAGAGANANLIFKTLEGKSDAERKAIIEDYKKKYGKDLPGELKEQLGGANLEKAQALLEKGPCYELKGEKLKSTIAPDKLKLIEKDLLNKEFSEKDLREKLAKSGLNEQDIETVLKDSKKDNLDSNTKLNIAMDRWGADKQAIFDTLQEASPETRQEILNNKDMMKKLEGELNDKDYAQAMGYLNSNQSGEVPLKDKLKSSMAGWGTDKNSFYDALDKASPEEIASLKNDSEMKKLFDSELNKEDRAKLNSIINEGKVSAKIKIKNSISFTGEDEKKIYEVLENASPEERKILMNDPEIKEIFSKNLDAREMSNVNLIMEKGKLPARIKIEQASKGAGTIEKDIFEALEKATPEERKELQKDPSIKKLLEEELGGNALLRAQILLEKGKTEPADDLYMAMKGAGTDRDAIYKALSSCKNNEEQDNLINTYRNKYNRDLQADLKEELAGTDYYKAFDMLQKEPKNLEERKEQMTEKLSRGRNSGDVWSQVSNNIMDVFSEEGRNVDDSERELRDTYKQVEKIEKQGGKPDAKLLEKLDKAENKVKVNIDDYEESKNKVADGLSTAASITAAVATSAVVTLATGGAGVVTVPLIIGSAITCATTKIAINKIVKGNSYDLNSTQALTDFATGAVEGALNVVGGPLMDKFATLSAGQRATVMSTIMKNPVITKALSKGTIEGMTSFVENKAVQEIVKDAISGAISSGIQGGITTAVDENTWSDGIGEGLKKVGESGVVQAETGLVTSAVMTTAFKAGGHILGKFKPKADTLDGLEVKLKEPEKFSKAKEILSEGSPSEAELTQKLKGAGFKDEELKSVQEHKGSVKTSEKFVTEERSVKKVDDTTVENTKTINGSKVTSDGEPVEINKHTHELSDSNKIKEVEAINEEKLEQIIPVDGIEFSQDIPRKSFDEFVKDIKDKCSRTNYKFADEMALDYLQTLGLNRDILQDKILSENELKEMLSSVTFVDIASKNLVNLRYKGHDELYDRLTQLLDLGSGKTERLFGKDKFLNTLRHSSLFNEDEINIVSDAIKLNPRSYSSLEISQYLSLIKKNCNQSILPLNIHEIKLGTQSIKFYGDEVEKEWIEEAIQHFPEDMKKKLIQKGGFRDVLVGDIKVDEALYKRYNGTTAIVKGVSKPATRQILLNKALLNKEFNTAIQLIDNLDKELYNQICDKSPVEIRDFIVKLEEELKLKPDDIKLKERIGLLRTSLNKTKNSWLDTFNHEVFHQFDYDLKKDKLYLSESISSFYKPEAHSISSYAQKMTTPSESAAETFKELMEERRRFAVEYGISHTVYDNKEFNKEFMQVINKAPCKEQYKDIIANYLEGPSNDWFDPSKSVKWTEIPNYEDYSFLLNKSSSEIGSPAVAGGNGQLPSETQKKSSADYIGQKLSIVDTDVKQELSDNAEKTDFSTPQNPALSESESAVTQDSDEKKIDLVHDKKYKLDGPDEKYGDFDETA